MKKLFLAIMLIGLIATACDAPSLTNDQIISETQKCEKAGLKAIIIDNEWNYHVLQVQCSPK